MIDPNFDLNHLNDSNVLPYASKLDQDAFTALLEFLSQYYYNDTSLVSDAIYDELIDLYESKYGPYEQVGAALPNGDKGVKLPYYMGSLEKLKDEHKLSNWIAKHPGPYILEDKIDGMSLMLDCYQGTVNLYTRGKGYQGQNVSHLLPYLNLPKIKEDITIRGELVIYKENFSLYADKFKNARNMAGGIMSAKKSFNPELAKLFTFIAYKIMSVNLTPSEDIALLQHYGFTLPGPSTADVIDFEMLEHYLERRKSQVPYEMDGIVIYQDIAQEYPEGGNPKHVVAFKVPTETAIATVTAVKWRGSKGNLLKPTVWYTPVTISGATLERASGHNARYIVNNNIGVGAVITIMRSGDVIPKIINIITPALQPDLPTDREYYWNENGVEFITSDAEDEEVMVGKLKHFFTTMGIKNVGPARLKILVEAGLHSLRDIMDASDETILQLPGLGKTFVTNLRTSLNELKSVPLSRVMDASSIFNGIGERRFEVILKAYPNLLEMTEVASHIKKLPGFNILADEIEEKLDDFIAWLNLYPEIGFTLPQAAKSDNLSGQTIVFSGFRDKDLEAQITDLGGKVTSTVTKQTTLLLVADVSENSTKVTKAKTYNIPIKLKSEFIEEL